MPDTSLDVDPVFEPVTLETASPATIANQAPHVDFVRREVVTETSTKSGGTGDERLHDLNNMWAWRAGALGTSLRFANWNREARGPASPDVSFVAMRPPDVAVASGLGEMSDAQADRSRLGVPTKLALDEAFWRQHARLSECAECPRCGLGAAGAGGDSPARSALASGI